jgi:hypothetical protein
MRPVSDCAALVFSPFKTPFGRVQVHPVFDRRTGSWALELRGEHRLLCSLLAEWRPRTAATRAVVRPPQPISTPAALTAFYEERALAWWVRYHTTPWPKSMARAATVQG